MYFSTRILTPVFKTNARYIALIIILVKIPTTLVPVFLVKVCETLSRRRRLGQKHLIVYVTAPPFSFPKANLLILGAALDILGYWRPICSVANFVGVPKYHPSSKR